MRRAFALLIVLGTWLRHPPLARAAEPEPPKPRWAQPFHQRHGCALRVLFLAGVVGAVAWGAGAFDVTTPDGPVPSQPLPDDAPQPPQQFPPPNVQQQIPDLP